MKTVCVDFDGVLAQYRGWKGASNIGEPIPGARDFLERLMKKGFWITIYSVRTNSSMTSGKETSELEHFVESWLRKHRMPFNEIYKGEGKPLAVAYVDDRGVSCCPQEDEEAFDKAFNRCCSLRHDQVEEPE